MNDLFVVGKWQWAEMQIAMGKYPQGLTLSEYVKRVPAPRKVSK